MGYPVPANSPQVTIGTRTVCAAAFDWNNPMGVFYKVGIFEKQGDGSWNSIGEVVTYVNEGDCLKDIQAKGGTVKYLQWLAAKINALFSAIFSAPAPPPAGEPTTDAQAKAYLTATFASLKLTNVNGVPVLQ